MFSVYCPNSNKNFFFTTCLGEIPQQVKLLCNRLDNQHTGSLIPDMARDFPILQSIQIICGVLQPSVQLELQALSPEGKLLRHQADNSPPSIAKLELYIHCHVWLHGMHRDTICTTPKKKALGLTRCPIQEVPDFRDYESRNDMNNSNYYCQMLQKSHTSSRRHHSKITDSIILLYDNAYPNVARRVEGQQNVKRLDMLKHAVQSLDLSPCNFHIIGPMKKAPQMLYGSCLVVMCWRCGTTAQGILFRWDMPTLASMRHLSECICTSSNGFQLYVPHVHPQKLWVQHPTFTLK